MAFLVRLACSLALVLFLSGPAQALELSAREQAYVRQHSAVPICVDPDWVPFERINEQGEHEGIAADLLALVAQRTGLRFELVRTSDWEQSIEASRKGQCKVLSFLNASPKREEWLSFTAPLLNDPNVFITREEHGFIADPSALSGETIALPKGTSVEEMVRKQLPYLAVALTDSENEAMKLVSERKADMTMRSLIVAAYTIRKEGLFNLKISGQMPEYANQLRMGVVHGEPVLLSILDKGVRSITPQEREQVVSRHVAIKVEVGMDYRLVLKIVGGFSLVVALSLYWILRLRRLNAEIKRLSNTDPLTGLFNRVKLHAQFPVELERAARYGRPLSLLLLDVDHFKRVNDELGHPAGDSILMAIARLISANTRANDIACRWGGEEFLVLCPETDRQQALALAERIRSQVESAEFSGGRGQSVSIGVASLEPGESAEALVKRADMALYRSKNAGRNKVSVL